MNNYELDKWAQSPFDTWAERERAMRDPRYKDHTSDYYSAVNAKDRISPPQARFANYKETEA